MNYLSLENLNLFRNRVKRILGLQDDEIRTIVNKQTIEVSDDSKKAIEEDLTKKLLAASTTGQIQILHPDEQLATPFNTTYTDYAITSTLKVSETKLYDEFVTLTSDDKSVHRIVFQCPLNSVTFKYWNQSESSEQSLKFTNTTENEVFTITPPSSTYPKWIISRGYTLYDDSSIQNNMQTLEYEIESEADTGVADVVNLVLKPYTGNYYLQTTKPDVVIEKSTYEDGKTVVSNTDSGMFHFIETIEEPVFSKQFRIVFKVGLKRMDIQWFNSWKLIQNISAGDILLLTTPSSETSNDWSITLLNPQLRSNDGSITIKELNNGGFDIGVSNQKLNDIANRGIIVDCLNETAAFTLDSINLGYGENIIVIATKVYCTVNKITRDGGFKSGDVVEVVSSLGVGQKNTSGTPLNIFNAGGSEYYFRFVVKSDCDSITSYDNLFIIDLRGT